MHSELSLPTGGRAPTRSRGPTSGSVALSVNGESPVIKIEPRVSTLREHLGLVPAAIHRRWSLGSDRELIAAIEFPPLDIGRDLLPQFRDRQSYQSGLVSAGVALEVRDGAVADVRLAPRRRRPTNRPSRAKEYT
jgi:hypothetical protein